MTQFLPPNLLALFAPRDPIPYKPPSHPLTWEKDRLRSPYTGIGHLVHLFEDPKDTPPPTRGEKKAEKLKRRIREKAEQRAEEITEEVKSWDPHNDPNATGDAFKTLFVGRINYDTSESKLRRELEQYGKIRKVYMVKNKATGKPRGYAFVEYEKERDMHTAYKSADGKKIDGRRVLVDVERGRTVKGWRPRRLGGGLGSTRAAPDEDRPGREREDRERDRGDRDRPRERERGERREPRSMDRTRDRDRHRERDRDREREKPRDRDRDREKRRDRDRGDRPDRTERPDRPDRPDRGDKGDRRERDRDRDKKRDSDRKERRRDEAGDADSGRKDERSRESRHKHRDRSRERDGSRRERHRDKDRDRSNRDASKSDVTKSESEYNSDFKPSGGEIKQENYRGKEDFKDETGYYGGDGMGDRPDNGYYKGENMEYEQEVKQEPVYNNNMEMKEQLYQEGEEY